MIKKKFVITLLLSCVIFTSTFGYAYAQSSNSTATNSTAHQVVNATDVGNFIPDQSSFIIAQFANGTGTYISLMNGDIIRTHYANGTAVIPEFPVVMIVLATAIIGTIVIVKRGSMIGQTI